MYFYSGLQRGLNPWPRNTGAMLYQLSYEAIDVGRRSIVGSYVPVKEMSVNDIWNKSYRNCGNEMKMKKWSSQWTQFMRKEAWKKLVMTYDLFHISLTIMDKSLGTLAFLGVFQFTQAKPLPSAHKQCWARVSRIFSEFQLCIGWGEGELRENFEKDELFYDGIQNDRKIRILHYCLKYFCPWL